MHEAVLTLPPQRLHWLRVNSEILAEISGRAPCPLLTATMLLETTVAKTAMTCVPGKLEAAWEKAAPPGGVLGSHDSAAPRHALRVARILEDAIGSWLRAQPHLRGSSWRF